MENENERMRATNPAGGSTREPEFPQLNALKDFDRQQHIERSMEAGLSREEAERHADEDLKGWSPTSRDSRPHEH